MQDRGRSYFYGIGKDGANVTGEEIAVKLQNHEGRIVGTEHRIKDLEKESESIHELVLSVNKLAINMENMLTEQREQGQRLKKLEDEPAERWNNAKKTAFTTIISVIAGSIATGLIFMVSQYL